MRFVPVLALLLAVPLTGCLTVLDDTESGPRTYPWGLEQCRYVIAVVPVAAERLQPLLPEGFTPRRSQPAGTEVLGLPDGELHADAYACDGATALDGGRLDGAMYGSFYVPVEPPQALADPAYPASFVKLDFLSWDLAAQDWLVSQGLPAHPGVAAVLPEGQRLTAFLSMDEGAGPGFTLVGTFGLAEAQVGDLPFLEATPLAGGGLAVWHARLHDATFARGAGVLQVQGPLRDVVGGDSVPVQFSTGTWNLDQADVTFPVAWPVAG